MSSSASQPQHHGTPQPNDVGQPRDVANSRDSQGQPAPAGPRAKGHRSALLGAMFLMATSAIGPGFITPVSYTHPEPTRH